MAARVTYRCLAGHRWSAEVVSTRPDGRVNLSVDALVRDRVELSRIEVVPVGDLRPGTCAIEQGAGDGAQTGDGEEA